MDLLLNNILFYNNLWDKGNFRPKFHGHFALSAIAIFDWLGSTEVCAKGYEGYRAECR